MTSRYVLALALSIGLGGSAVAAPEAAKAVDPELTMSSLTGEPGDPKSGRKLAINRKKGNCLACHVMPIPEEQFHGHIGPDLHGVANRYTEGEIRLRVVDPKRINEETMMPAFFRIEGLHRVAKAYQGKPILAAQEIEDVVAYLMTLTEDPR